MLLKLLKRVTKRKVDKNFDQYYDIISSKAREDGYIGDIKIISDNKWVNFYVTHQED